jgi:NADPH2 dehydrogenase
MKDLDRFSPLGMNRGRTLRNRVVVPPMASQTADELGRVTPQTLAHYARLAEAGPGLLLVEYSFVARSGRSEAKQLGAADDTHTAGLAAIAATIRRTGALAGLQLSHGGGKSSLELTGGDLQAPSAIAVPVKGTELERPRAAGAADIVAWRDAFVAAADRAVAAGFDWVELHSAHGYGLNQWLSPLTNRRTDRYGGDREGRSRLLREIVTAIRARYPELLLSVRIPGQDFLPGGLGVADGQALAAALERAGVDAIHVSSGIGGWRRPESRRGQGYLVAEAAAIARAVRCPVIGVGGIESGEYIDEGLRAGRFALAAVGRAILADPKAWAERNLIRAPAAREDVCHAVG